MDAAEKHERGRQGGVLWPHALPSVPTGPQHIPDPACPALPSPPAALSCALSSPGLPRADWQPLGSPRPLEREEAASLPERQASQVRESCECHQVAPQAQDNPGAALQAGGGKGLPGRPPFPGLRVRPSSSAHTPSPPPRTSGDQPPGGSLSLPGTQLCQESKPNKAVVHGEHAIKVEKRCYLCSSDPQDYFQSGRGTGGGTTALLPLPMVLAREVLSSSGYTSNRKTPDSVLSVTPGRPLTLLCCITK